MKIDLLPIISVEGGKLPFTGKVVFETDSFSADCTAKGQVEQTGGTIEVDGRAEVVVHTKCARCLCDVDAALSVPFSGPVSNEEYDNVLEGTLLDLAEVVRANVLLAVAPKYICKDDCKGLCAGCGADLNDGPCKCKHDAVDERLAKLKELLN